MRATQVSSSLLLLIAVALQCTINIGDCFSTQSNRYPAGIHPAVCPNYPYCDNNALAALHSQHSEHLLGVASTHQATYPAAVDPHSCPNYPYCSHEIPAEAIHYKRSYHSDGGFDQHYHNNRRSEYPSAAASANAAYYIQPLSIHNKYPAGVNPASCPNYPYCH